MTDLAAVAVGAGIGLLIALPALVAYRQDIWRHLRSLWAAPEVRQTGQGKQRGAAMGANSVDGVRLDDNQPLSSAITVFGIGAASVSVLYGLLWGGAVFVATGMIGVLSVGLACLGSRVRRH